MNEDLTFWSSTGTKKQNTIGAFVTSSHIARQKFQYLDLNPVLRRSVCTRSFYRVLVIIYLLARMRSKFHVCEICAKASQVDRYVLRSQLLPHSLAFTDYVLALALSSDEKVVASGGTKLRILRVDTGELLRSFDWTGRCTFSV
jgi:hypothetical protein